MAKFIVIISTTGRRPNMAIPTAVPAIPASAIGVSITRFGPYFFSIPAVMRNVPSYTPMSSPMMRTFGSRSISSIMASRIASR